MIASIRAFSSFTFSVLLGRYQGRRFAAAARLFRAGTQARPTAVVARSPCRATTRTAACLPGRSVGDSRRSLRARPTINFPGSRLSLRGGRSRGGSVLRARAVGVAALHPLGRRRPLEVVVEE